MARIVGNWRGGSVWCITSGEFPSNSYFCETNTTGGGILIDAGLDGIAIDEQISAIGLRPDKIFCTHGHFDHIGSTDYFQRKYGCQIFLHKGDAKIIKSNNFLLMALKINRKIIIPQVTLVDDQFELEIDGYPIKFKPTPGHTPGSCVIEFGDAWFTGDTIYARGIGLSGLPGENTKQLRQSILNLWSSLTPEITIFPGHGNSANGANVRSQNIALNQFLFPELK